jgi:hypothetical protein
MARAAFIGQLNLQGCCAVHHFAKQIPKGLAVPLKKAANGSRVVHASRPVLSNDAGGVQLDGSGDTADD